MKIAGVSTNFNTHKRKKKNNVSLMTLKSNSYLHGSCQLSFGSNPIFNLTHKQVSKTGSKINSFDPVFFKEITNEIKKLNQVKKEMKFDWNESDKGMKKHLRLESIEFLKGIIKKDVPNMLEEAGDLINLSLRAFEKYGIDPQKALKYSFKRDNEKINGIKAIVQLRKETNKFFKAVKTNDSIVMHQSAGNMLKIIISWIGKHNINPLEAGKHSVNKIGKRLNYTQTEAKRVFGKLTQELSPADRKKSWDYAKKLEKANQ